MAENPYFELPDKIERCLAALSKLYAQEGNRSLQRIIVNAQIRVKEYTSFNPTRGHGHTVHLTIPDSIYLANATKRAAVEEEIADDLNKLHNVQNEFIDSAFLEMDVPEDSDWRQESGLLVGGVRQVGLEAVRRIWAEDEFRLFLSHKAEVKAQVGRLKDDLSVFGVSAFVAHADIAPTQEWQDEIENALATTDGFVALLTQGFHESDWTDQEVGYALARGIPIIAARLERNPYGFLGKFQAMPCTWESAPEEIVKLLIRSDRMLSAYMRALGNCGSFDEGNVLSRILPSIASMTEKQVDDVIEAVNDNSQLRGSFGFNGSKPMTWGSGLLPHLHRWGARRYDMNGAGFITPA